MNPLTPHVIDDGERARIASRSDIDVFVPAMDGTNHVSDLSGNYWPYRSLSFAEATQNRTSTEKTLRRTSTLRIVDNRPPGSNFPIELFETADSLYADEVLPAVYTGTSRDAIANPVINYENYDFQNHPSLVIPVPRPYELTTACIKSLLYKDGQDIRNEPEGIKSRHNPTDFAIRGFGESDLSYSRLSEIVSTLGRVTPGDINIHLHEPPINSNLVRFLNNHRGTIDSVTLPKSAQYIVPNRTEATDGTHLSKKGSENLNAEICPLVRIATELSLLVSDLLKESLLNKTLEASVIPSTTDFLTISGQNPNQTPATLSD